MLAATGQGGGGGMVAWPMRSRPLQCYLVDAPQPGPVCLLPDHSSGNTGVEENGCVFSDVLRDV